MSLEASPLAAAVPGLVRSDPHGRGITRVRDDGGFRYLDPSGNQITDAATLDRIQALRIPPAWADVWISPDPVGHIQAMGADSKGRLQYLYHRLWREQRDAQKFGHMLRFAGALPTLRTAAANDLRHRALTRDRVVASVVRLIDLGMFRIGGERYAELDHHYGATTLRKQHVRFTRDGIMFDYVAKWGKQRTIVIRDNLVQPTIRALARIDNDLDTLWSYEQDGRWHILHSRDVSNYIAARADGHFTAKEFRTWNATVLMALALANAGPSSTPPGRKRTIAASVREVADWLGDTPAVARNSYIDPRLIARYEADGHLPTVPPAPIALPASPEAETAVAALLAISADPAPGQPGRPGLSGALPARVRFRGNALCKLSQAASAETLTRLRQVRRWPGQLNPLTRRQREPHDRTVIVKPNRDRRTERHEAIRREILDAAWDAAHETSIAGLTLRDIATRVGMQQPSLYSHFASKQAIYDAMFKQAWQAYLDDARNAIDGLPAEPRARLIAIAEHYFDFAVADLPRHQLMDVNVVPNFQPSPEAYAPAMQAYDLMLDQLRGMGISKDEDADIYTALIGGLVNQQLANDPGGQRWRRLIPRVIAMFADDLGLP